MTDTIDHFQVAERLLNDATLTPSSQQAAEFATVALAHIELGKLQTQRGVAMLTAVQSLPDRQVQQERDELVAEIDVLLDRKRRLEASIVVNQRILGDKRALVDEARRVQASLAAERAAARR